MDVKVIKKASFSVIGKQGSTLDGAGFIEQLWSQANTHFHEVSDLAKKNEKGHFSGFWGAMSDMTLSFMPWTDHFSKGLYLAGVEVYDHAIVPEGWTKWTIPAYEYLVFKNENNETFRTALTYLNENHMKLVGAVQEFISPIDQVTYLYFPIKHITA